MADADVPDTSEPAAEPAPSTPPAPMASRLPAWSVKRVGVVVVHGVADQARGATLALLTKKLVAAGVLVGDGRDAPLLLSIRSPFGRPGGLTAPPEVTEIARRTGHTTADGTRVDLLELTWSDLSRPGSSLVSMVQTFVALLGNLPSLGARELRKAQDAGWKGAPGPLFEAAAAIHEHVVPMLLGLTLALFASLPGLALAQREPAIGRGVAAALLGLAPVVALLWTGRLGELGPRPDRTWWLPFLLAAFSALAIWVGFGMLARVGPLVLATSATAAAAFALHMLFRVPLARRPTLTKIGLVVAGLALSVGIVRALVVLISPQTVGEADPQAGVFSDGRVAEAQALATTGPALRAVMSAVELLYVLTAVAFVTGLAALIAGAVVGWARLDGTPTQLHRRRHALRTAIVAAGLPMLVFLVTALPLLAAAFDVIDRAQLVPLGAVDPWIHPTALVFGDPSAKTHSAAALAGALVRASGTRFFVIVLLALGFVALIFVVIAVRVAPAEIAEPRLLGVRPAPRLASGATTSVRTEPVEIERDDVAYSRWLERGTYVIADWAVIAVLTSAVLVVLGFALEAAACAPEIRVMLEGSALGVSLAHASGELIFASGAVLAGSASLLALPGRLREVLGPLWPVLDVLLDVEGYLRPRIGAPSTRELVLERATSLLAHLESYDSIVVVAHSQGTLIAAEALRARGRRGRTVRLVTMGSPLANLYHRFLPHTFDWLERARRDPAAALGVASWDNVFAGGDYVGRSVIHTELLDAVERGAKPNAAPSGVDRSPPGLRGHRGWSASPLMVWEHGVHEHRLGPFGHTRYWDLLGAEGDAVTEVLGAAVAGHTIMPVAARRPHAAEEPAIGSLSGVLLAAITGLGTAALVLGSSLIGPFIMFTLPVLLLFGSAIGPLVAAANGALDGDHAAGLRGAFRLWSRTRSSEFSVETVPTPPRPTLGGARALDS